MTSVVAENVTEKSKKRNHSVYVLKDDNDVVKYVGRTKNVEKRKAAHKLNPFRKELHMEVIADNLNYEEARALEQSGMAYHHTINTLDKAQNQINGIAPSNWKPFKAVARGVLDYGWNQMTNEILYWLDS